ncbi:MAG: ABC transporter ATP-binding protein [archaeon]|nr:ABC transporter ATP-binding protein [archaeon]
MAIIEATGVEFSYEESKIILNGVDMCISPGEIIGILGPNGCGKTTFIKCLNKIHEPQQGHIALLGEDIKELTYKQVAQKVGYVPQNSVDEMSAPNVFDVVLMGRMPHTTWHCTEEDEERVWHIMEELDVAHLASHGFNELSSGQSQRVLMARAIAQEAKVMLLDEPTSNLDIKYQLEVMNMVSKIVTERGVSAVAIIHDLDLALRYCDKVALLHNGKVHAFGPADEVLTKENIRTVYKVDAEVVEMFGRKRIVILDNISAD